MSPAIFRQLFAFLLIGIFFIAEANAATYWCKKDADNDGFYKFKSAQSTAGQLPPYPCPSSIFSGNGWTYATDKKAETEPADNCPAIANTDQLNTDGDANGNVCDQDDDNDSVPDTSDAFPLDATESVDTDADGVGDNTDAFPLDATESVDSDADGIGNLGDNCPTVSNASQVDADGDGTGDACAPQAGGLDSSFGTNGKVITYLNSDAYGGGANMYAADMLQLPDGKLKVAAHGNQGVDTYSSELGYLFNVYETNGILNSSSFIKSVSNSQPSITPTGNWTSNVHVGSNIMKLVINNTHTDINMDRVAPVIEQADGKLVVVGTSSDSIFSYSFLLRYNAAGTLADTTFSGDGLVTPSYIKNLSGVVQQSSGKLVVVGYNNDGVSDNFALMRFNENGTLDNSFGNSGAAVANLTTGSDRVNGVIIQPADGKLVVVGTTGIARFLKDGLLDTTFHSSGMVNTNFVVQSVALQADGKIVVAGSGNNDFVVARYLVNGQPDPVFGIQGKVSTDIGSIFGAGSIDYANKVIVQSDGAIVVVGTTKPTSASRAFDLAIVRYLADPDTDGDSISDADETAISNNPLNNLDPPIAAISSQYILGIDNRTAGISAFTTLWDNVEGGSPSSDSCDNCIVPGTDITTSASADVCGVNANGIKCLWWVMDTGDVNNEELLPLQIAGETVTPLHDWDGYLKYVDSLSVLRHAVTDAFKISSDHFSHTCIVSKTAGVYCWASHSGTDIVSSNVPAALQNVSTVKDIAVGANHACAINSSAVECWGESASGKTTVPVIVNAPKQIAAGANHSCAINANGSVSCWGDNSTNQLSDSNTDGLVDGVSNALKISAGKNHTCAVTGNYSTPSGLRVTCWGDNSAGQTTVPVALSNGVEKPVNITAAENQTCAIRVGQNVAANAMICWPVTVAP